MNAIIQIILIFFSATQVEYTQNSTTIKLSPGGCRNNETYSRVHDSLPCYPQNTLSKLQDKDTISINFLSQGCFHTTVSKILITKRGNEFSASIYEGEWCYVLLKTVTLTKQNIQEFTRFENELNFVTDEGCTTTDLYHIKSKYLDKKAIDGGCDWDGFYYLRRSFFGSKE